VPKRYAPERTFPPYTYSPGRAPHPTQDPAGHSHGRENAPRAAHFARERWRENSDYLLGVDLYNHGFLWEAHEAWEGIWHAARGDERQASFLQGLIQCTAAALKLSMEQPRGARRLGVMGAARLRSALRQDEPSFMGLGARAFAAAFLGFVNDETADAEERPRIVLAD
jgi:hypothetical protein